MTLVATYVKAHVPIDENADTSLTPHEAAKKLLNTNVLRAFISDLLAPNDASQIYSLDLRWTAALAGIARYKARRGPLSTAEEQAVETEVRQWLPCAATANNPKTGKTCFVLSSNKS